MKKHTVTLADVSLKINHMLASDEEFGDESKKLMVTIDLADTAKPVYTLTHWVLHEEEVEEKFTSLYEAVEAYNNI